MAGYYESTGELDKAIDAYRLAIANYPRDWGFHNDLSTLLIDLGQFEEGLQEGQAAARLQPNVEEPPYRRQLDAYMCLDRLGEAKKVAETVRKLGIGGARIHQRFLEMAYIEGDQAAAARETQWYAGKPEEYLSFGLQAANRNVLGQRRSRANCTSEPRRRRCAGGSGTSRRDSTKPMREPTRCRVIAGPCAVWGVRHWRWRCAAIRPKRRSSPGRLRSSFQTEPSGMQCNYPRFALRSQLQRDQPAKAVELLASASPYERAYPGVPYLRGLAYLRLHKGAEAAAEFQKILDHKGASWGSTWLYPNWGLYYSISYLGLARGSALAGDTAKARKRLPGLLRTVEGRRPRHPDPPASQGGIREVAVRCRYRRITSNVGFGKGLSARTILPFVTSQMLPLSPSHVESFVCESFNIADTQTAPAMSWRYNWFDIFP